MNELIDLLVRSGAAGSAAIALVLVLRKGWRRAFGSSSVLWLWLLVPAALLAVLLPAPVVWLPATTTLATPANLAAAPAALATTPTGLDWPRLLLALWAVGAGLFALRMAQLQWRFRRLLGELRVRADGTRLASEHRLGPVLIGLLRPRIVLPADFEQRYSPLQRELVLAHERTHLYRGDLLINAVVAALRCVHWFNPLWHIAASRLRFDQELACDAAVLARFPHARRAYADAMLNTQLAVPGLPVGCAWQSSHPLIERIAMLKHSKPSRARMFLAVALAVAGSGVGGYTAWAAQPAEVKVADSEVPTWASKRINVSGRDATLRQAVEAVASQANARVANAELLDREAPSADIDFQFEDMRVKTTINSLLDGRAVHAEYRDNAVVIVATANASATASPTATVTQAPSYARLAPPTYPQSAAKDAVSGYVMLRVELDSTGNPQRVSVERSQPAGVFDAAAIAAVQAWKFNPAQRDGRPVESVVKVPLQFAAGKELPSVPATENALDAIWVRPPA